jgi:hypothetical protein
VTNFPHNTESTFVAQAKMDIEPNMPEGAITVVDPNIVPDVGDLVLTEVTTGARLTRYLVGGRDKHGRFCKLLGTAVEVQVSLK